MKSVYLYHRCSTIGQSAERCYMIAEEMGIPQENVFVDFISGTTKALDRPAFSELYSRIDSNSQIVVVSTNRIGRRAAVVLDAIEQVHQKGASIFIKDIGIDSNSKAGGIVVAVFASIAEGEYEDIKEAQAQGIAAKKKANGKCGGRPSVPDSVMEAAVTEYMKGAKPVAAVCQDFNISVSKLYKYMKAKGISRR